MPPHKRLKVTKGEDKNSSSNHQPSTSKGNCSDWRDSKDNVKNRQKHALQEGLLTDITFAVGPAKTKMTAHKVILALASPVFEAMFYGTLKETTETIEIPDLSPEGFKLLLDFIYTDDMIFSCPKDAFGAWTAADKYCLTYMKDGCYKYLSTCTLEKLTVWHILENALFFDLQPLVDRCLVFLREEISDVISSPHFVETSKDAIKTVLMMDQLRIKEVKLLDNIVKWADEQAKNFPEESIGQLVQPFLKYIRFGCMSQKEFAFFIGEHKGIISDADVIDVFKFMTDCKLYSLPEWCSSNVYPRYAHENRQNTINIINKKLSFYTLAPQQSTRFILPNSHPDNVLFPNYRDRDDHLDDHEDNDIESDQSQGYLSDSDSDVLSPRPERNMEDTTDTSSSDTSFTVSQGSSSD